MSNDSTPSGMVGPRLRELLSRERPADKESLIRAFAGHLEYGLGKYKYNVTNADAYHALAGCVRDVLIDHWNSTRETQRESGARRVYYLSMEFLPGNLLNNQLLSLGLRDVAARAMEETGFSLDRILAYEPDPGLGNGGLGRLAACLLDSMAALKLPCSGSSLRYEYGLFRQLILDGFQREAPDNWLARGNPWEVPRLDLRYPVHFYGSVSAEGDWTPGETVFANAYDMLFAGHGTGTAVNLRLWSAGSYNEFNLKHFNYGDYERAMEDALRSEQLTKVLYPRDDMEAGRELRLKQEYLLVCATLKDALRTLEEEGGAIRDLPERVVFHLNDTHPALAIAELMRILHDVRGFTWEEAWDMTNRSTAFTNHTVLPEALEVWDADLLGRLLPRHLQIISRINHNFLEELRERGYSEEFIQKVSLYREDSPRRVSMAHLALLGAGSVNGVSRMHSDILREKVFPEQYELWPEKFGACTNGIDHRRWLLSANEHLSDLISKRIGRKWIKDTAQLRELERYAGDPEFQADWRKVRLLNKERLASIIRFESGQVVEPSHMFDIHVKRLHEYKRQLLNVLRLLEDYRNLKANPVLDYAPRVVVFSGKAAPGYRTAKLILKLIHSAADLINRDPDLDGRLKVVFIPDFRVSLAEHIYPAADLSEQISTAGKEASGTGNMKFMLNGALTIGTLDGANIEMLEAAGKENIYIFGHTADELRALREKGYDPRDVMDANESLRETLDILVSGELTPDSPELFAPIHHSLADHGDEYFVLADYADYRRTQDAVSRDFRDVSNWTRRSIMNTARSGVFSSDRTVAQYAREYWHVRPVG